MKTIDRTSPVLVTGAAGYMASWIVKMLLEEGIDVHATVRDPADLEKTAHLRALVKPGSGRLDLFRADLLDGTSFDEAAAGCELVIHTASPFFLTGVRHAEEELVRPAREGTINVLSAAARAGTVKRIVLTSSVAAVYGDNADIRTTPSGIFTENDWNTTSSIGHQPYSYSKTIAEKTAWQMAKEQGQWDLVTINPGFILGPSLSKRKDSTSISTMVQIGDGTFKNGVPELWCGIVDVRDVAAAHIRAGFTPGAKGRHILVSGEATFFDLARILRRKFGDAYPFPRRQVPKTLFWLLGPFYGYTRRFVSRNVGILIRFDNSYSVKDLGISFISVDRTVDEHFQQILNNGMLEKDAR
jgi:nucleoside-diphosphate-sugar epimerase